MPPSKRTVRKPPRTPSDLPAPLIKAKRPVEADEPRVVVFTLEDADGAEIEYSIPARVQPHLGLQYIADAARYGLAGASVFLLERALGDEAYQALTTAEGLDGEQLKQISELVARVVLGKRESSAG